MIGGLCYKDAQDARAYDGNRQFGEPPRKSNSTGRIGRRLGINVFAARQTTSLIFPMILPISACLKLESLSRAKF